MIGLGDLLHSKPFNCISTKSLKHIAHKAHAVVLMDRAGWHSTGKLIVPKNLTIILLPPKSPELNPVENIWQYLRANYLSNRVFSDDNAIVDAACDAWNALMDTP